MRCCLGCLRTVSRGHPQVIQADFARLEAETTTAEDTVRRGHERHSRLAEDALRPRHLRTEALVPVRLACASLRL